MSDARTKVVFDCVIFAQALISDVGPAATCLRLARSRTIELIWSDYVLQEIRELPAKLPARLLVTTDRIEAFVQDVATFATLRTGVAAVYHNPLDPDDSHYVDLAVAASATIITSRDHHLLELMNDATPHGREFRQRFPQIEVITPNALLKRVSASS